MLNKANSEESIEEGNINVNVAKNENTEFQRFITEIKGMDIVFYQALCGWRTKRNISEKTYLDIPIPEYSNYFIIDTKMRYCNEEFASTLSNSIYGLVSHITTTGNLTEREIYDLWDGLIDSINYDITTDYTSDNFYQIKIQSADRITAFCCEFSAYTKKARSGTTLKAFAETILSIFNTRLGGTEQKEKSLKDKILSLR